MVWMALSHGLGSPTGYEKEDTKESGVRASTHDLGLLDCFSFLSVASRKHADQTLAT